VRIKSARIAVDVVGVFDEAASAATGAGFLNVDQVLMRIAGALAADEKSALDMERVDARLGGVANLGCLSKFRPDVNSLCPRRQSSICVIEYFTPAFASRYP